MRLHFNINLTTSQKKAYELLKDKETRMLVIKWSRQCGKTVFAELMLIEYLLTKNKSMNAYISPSFSQGRKVYKEIVELIPKQFLKAANASTLTIDTINGSRLQFFSAESPTAIRGNTVNGIMVVDEAAFFPDELADGSDIWSNVIYPIIKAHYRTNKILLISTPAGKRGFFFRLYNRAGLDTKGRKNNRGIKNMSATIYDDDLTTREQIEEIKSMTSEMAFRAEFLCEFLDSQLTYFRGFEDCFDVEEINNTDAPTWIGIDLSAYGEDETIMTFINAEGYVWQKEISGHLNERYKRIAQEINNTKALQGCYIENNGVGAPMFEEIIKLVNKPYLRKIKPFTTTNASKNEICGSLAVAISERKVHFLPNKKLFGQLGTFIYKYTKLGKVQLEAMAGSHDDTVLSLAIAHYCRVREVGASYTIDNYKPIRKPKTLAEKYG